MIPGSGRAWIALRTTLNRRAERKGNPPLKDRLSSAALAMIENDDPASKLKAKATRDRLAALKIALGEVGVKEEPAGSNSGPRVSQYEAVAGINHQPWCACFGTWCFKQAGVLLSGFNVAYCPSWVASAHADQHGLRVIGHSEIEPGDVAIYDWNNDGVGDHWGFVISSTPGGHKAVEGNTSVAGSQSNGGEVCIQDRSLSDVECYIRVSG